MGGFLFKILFNPKKIFRNTFIAIILGAVVAVYFPQFMLDISVVGSVFIALLRMIVLPMVLSVIVFSIVSLGSGEALRHLGLRSVGWYMLTSGAAILLAVFIAGNINMAAFYSGGIDVNYNPGDKIQSMGFSELVLSFIPSNIYKSLTEFSMAQTVTFAVIFGVASLFIKEEYKKVVLNLSGAVNDVMLKIAHGVILLTPYGVFSLIGVTVAKSGLRIFESLWLYFLVVSLSLIFFVVIFHSFLVKAFARKSLTEHYRVAKDQLIMAFSTASSVATIPQTMDCAERLGVNSKVAGFTIPLGATANMSGTSLYLVIATVFIGQLAGHQFIFSEYIAIVLMVLILGIGVSGTPGASIVALVLVLDYLKLPFEYISVVLVVDRILDQIRTAVNVHDDLVIARILTRDVEKGRLKLDH